MKEIYYFRTYSWGGMEGRTQVIRNFETIELAKEDAINDTWNEAFTLYEIKLTFNGRVVENERFLEKIACGRDLARENYLNENNKSLVLNKKKKVKHN